MTSCSAGVTLPGQATPTDLSLPSLFHVQQIAADYAVLRRRRHWENVAQKAVRVWKKVQVRVEGEPILALEWHNDDEPLTADAPQLCDRQLRMSSTCSRTCVQITVSK